MIYLDYAAATPVSDKVLSAMQPYFSELFFNPSAPYLPARQIKQTYESAKQTIANVIGAKGTDLIITSGATEATNLAFADIDSSATHKTTILTLTTEHDSVRNIAPNLTTEITVDKNGTINLQDLASKITPETRLVSVALANNETGTIQPITKIAEIIQTERTNRLKSSNYNPILLHSDASQALGLVEINVARLGIDLMTLSAAKIYGPKGIGALYVKRGIHLKPLIIGGGQERGLRSGTENVPLLIGFATAMTETKHSIPHLKKHYNELRQAFLQNLTPKNSEFVVLTNPKQQLLNFLPISFPNLDAERLIFMLEEQGIIVSTGAACAASKGLRSRALKAMDLPDAIIAGSLRITFGKPTTKQDAITAAKIITQAAEQEFNRMQNSHFAKLQKDNYV